MVTVALLGILILLIQPIFVTTLCLETAEEDEHEETDEEQEEREDSGQSEKWTDLN